MAVSIARGSVMKTAECDPYGYPVTVSVEEEVPVLSSIFIRASGVVLGSFEGVSCMRRLGAPRGTCRFVLSFSSCGSMEPVEFGVAMEGR